jgi:four helix bundle protein
MYNTFEDMPVWQKAMNMAVRTFEITEKLPRKEDYGLTSQIRKSALSVPGNLAEGFGRKHTRDKLKFFYSCRGSLAETKNQENVNIIRDCPIFMDEVVGVPM